MNAKDFTRGKRNATRPKTVTLKEETVQLIDKAHDEHGLIFTAWARALIEENLPKAIAELERAK